MKKYLIGIGIVIVAGILMGLPYLLREVNSPDQIVHEKENLNSEVIQAVSKTEVSSETVIVDIVGFKFTPQKLIVKKGTTVQWTNKDSVPHTVTGDTNGPDSSMLKKNESYSYTFNQTGIFGYYCKPHPSMKGSVEVIE